MLILPFYERLLFTYCKQGESEFVLFLFYFQLNLVIMIFIRSKK